MSLLAFVLHVYCQIAYVGGSCDHLTTLSVFDQIIMYSGSALPPPSFLVPWLVKVLLFCLRKQEQSNCPSKVYLGNGRMTFKPVSFRIVCIKQALVLELGNNKDRTP